MPRFDSFDLSFFTPGSKLTGLQSDQTTIVTKTGLNKGLWLFSVTGSCDVAFNYEMRLLNAAGTQTFAQIREIAAGQNEDWIIGSPFQVNDGDELRCVLIGAVTPTVGLQLSLGGTRLQ